MEYKLVVLGSKGTGKSALVRNGITRYSKSSDYLGTLSTQTAPFLYLDSKFGEDYPTIEDCSRKIVEVDGQQFMLEVFDLEREIYPVMRDLCMENGQGFVLVYSITTQSTFNDLIDLRDQILHCKKTDVVPMVLVGNKCDLEDERVVTKEQGENLAKQFGNCIFMESSAKIKINIDKVFYDLVRQIVKTQAEKDHEKSNTPGNRRCGIL